MNILADNCKRLRAAKGWTQAQAHQRLGFSVKMYESGKRKQPREQHLRKLAKAFGVAIPDLLYTPGLSAKRPAASAPRQRRSA